MPTHVPHVHPVRPSLSTEPTSRIRLRGGHEWKECLKNPANRLRNAVKRHREHGAIHETVLLLPGLCVFSFFLAVPSLPTSMRHGPPGQTPEERGLDPTRAFKRDLPRASRARWESLCRCPRRWSLCTEPGIHRRVDTVLHSRRRGNRVSRGGCDRWQVHL